MKNKFYSIVMYDSAKFNIAKFAIISHTKSSTISGSEAKKIICEKLGFDPKDIVIHDDSIQYLGDNVTIIDSDK